MDKQTTHQKEELEIGKNILIASQQKEIMELKKILSQKENRLISMYEEIEHLTQQKNKIIDNLKTITLDF